MPKRYLLMLLAAFVLIDAGCNKEQPRPAHSIDPSEHVGGSPVGTGQVILQKTFALKSSEIVPFEIPAHAVRPHLHGMFLSFAGAVHGASDDTANIDFLIVNEEQHADLVSNHPSEALFSVEESHNQAVNFDLPASFDHSMKYYLVFRNPEGGKKGKAVEANFRVDF